MTPDLCPNCGAEVPKKARACPECGADETTGWHDRATTQRLGVSDEDDFDHDEFVQEEFGSPRSRPMKPLWFFTGVALLVAVLWWVAVR